MRCADAFRALSSDPDYRYWFDPFWVRVEPYRLALQPGQAETVSLHVRNFRTRKQNHRIEIHTPPGVTAEPAVLEGELGRESRRSFPIRIKASADADPGVRIVALDVTLDGHRHGEQFDFVIGIGPEKVPTDFFTSKTPKLRNSTRPSSARTLVIASSVF